MEVKNFDGRSVIVSREALVKSRNTREVSALLPDAVSKLTVCLLQSDYNVCQTAAPISTPWVVLQIDKLLIPEGSMRCGT